MTIENFNICNYTNGVFLNGSTKVSVSTSTISDALYAIFETNSSYATFSQNHLFDNRDTGVEISLVSSNNNEILQNRIEAEVLLTNSSGNIIHGNDMRYFGLYYGGVCSIWIYSGESNLVVANEFSYIALYRNDVRNTIVAANNISSCSLYQFGTNTSGNLLFENNFEIITGSNPDDEHTGFSWDNGTLWELLWQLHPTVSFCYRDKWDRNLDFALRYS